MGGRRCRVRGGGICHLGKKPGINRAYRRIKTFDYAARAVLPEDCGSAFLSERVGKWATLDIRALVGSGMGGLLGNRAALAKAAANFSRREQSLFMV